MRKFFTLLVSVLLCVSLCLSFASCGKTDESKEPAKSAEEKITGHPHVKFTMENGETFVIELYPEYAPETVANFIELVSSGFYDGLTFHRVITNFMAQGGMPKEGVNPKTIKGEFAANGFDKNELTHERGVVSMARRSDDYDSASSQFFICYADCFQLDGQYAAFGKVIDGMGTIDGFTGVELKVNSSGELAEPVTPIVIQSAVLEDAVNE